MNAKAAALGALDTRAVNPHGLDAPGQVSSAYDLALIARAGLDDPDFARYVSTKQASIAAPGGARIATANKNKLLYRYPGALGIKNGYTNAARASFIGAAERDGRRLVVTLMKADPRVFDEAVEAARLGLLRARRPTPVGELVHARAGRRRRRRPPRPVRTARADLGHHRLGRRGARAGAGGRRAAPACRSPSPASAWPRRRCVAVRVRPVPAGRPQPARAERRHARRRPAAAADDRSAPAARRSRR